MALSAARLRAPRAHLLARDPKCDTVTVLNMAARKRPGLRNADMNAVAGTYSDWNLHYPDGPEANHFTHRINPTTKTLERMPEGLRDVAITRWQDDQIRAWRKNIRTEVKPKWVRPFTVEERQRQARRRLVTVGWELKSRAYGTQPALAHRFVAALNRAGGRWFVMTLVSMKLWAEKLTNFHLAGAQTGLLAHDAPRPRDLARYDPSVIDAILGSFQ